MLLVAIIIALIVIVASLRNSQGTLFAALVTDVPGYVVWAAALVAVGAIGYVKPLKNISDALIVLIITVLLVNNYKNIIAGVQGVAQTNAGVTPSASAADAGNGAGASAGTAAGTAAGAAGGGANVGSLVGSNIGSLINGNSSASSDSNGNALDDAQNLVTV